MVQPITSNQNIPETSATRILDILEFLARRSTPAPATIIGNSCGIPRSSLYALLRVLRARRFVTYQADQRTWSLGPATHELSAVAPLFSHGLAVLRAIAASPCSLTPREIASQAPLPRSVIDRIIPILETSDFVHADPGGTYSLGLEIVSLASRLGSVDSLRIVSRAPLAQLRDATQETACLLIRDGDHALYIDQVESRNILRTSSWVGRRIPLAGTATGAAFADPSKPHMVHDAVEQGVTSIAQALEISDLNAAISILAPSWRLREFGEARAATMVDAIAQQIALRTRR